MALERVVEALSPTVELDMAWRMTLTTVLRMEVLSLPSVLNIERASERVRRGLDKGSWTASFNRGSRASHRNGLRPDMGVGRSWKGLEEGSWTAPIGETAKKGVVKVGPWKRVVKGSH